jgi:hypothetical protein
MCKIASPIEALTVPLNEVIRCQFGIIEISCSQTWASDHGLAMVTLPQVLVHKHDFDAGDEITTWRLLVCIELTEAN